MPSVIAGLNPFAESSALEVRTPMNEAENCTSEKSPARLSFRAHLDMNMGRMGPMSEITMPLMTKPAQRR